MLASVMFHLFDLKSVLWLAPKGGATDQHSKASLMSCGHKRARFDRVAEALVQLPSQWCIRTSTWNFADTPATNRLMICAFHLQILPNFVVFEVKLWRHIQKCVELEEDNQSLEDVFNLPSCRESEKIVSCCSFDHSYSIVLYLVYSVYSSVL